jgi:hypothetical protein
VGVHKGAKYDLHLCWPSFDELNCHQLSIFVLHEVCDAKAPSAKLPNLCSNTQIAEFLSTVPLCQRTSKANLRVRRKKTETPFAGTPYRLVVGVFENYPHKVGFTCKVRFNLLESPFVSKIPRLHILCILMRIHLKYKYSKYSLNTVYPRLSWPPRDSHSVPTETIADSNDTVGSAAFAPTISRVRRKRH